MRYRVWVMSGVIVALGVMGCDSLSTRVGYNEAKAVADALVPAISFTALAADGHLYYAASVDTTSLSLQNLLRSLNLPVTVTRDPNGTVRIASAIPDGTRFVLVLQQAPVSPASNPGPTQTHVFVEWQSGADPAHGFKMLADLEVQHKKQSG